MPGKKGSRGEVPPEGEEVPASNDETEESILAAWSELKGIPIDQCVDEGWRPRVKSKTDGKRYITIRHREKDPQSNKYLDKEKSLGPYSLERWELITKLFPSNYPREHKPRTFEQSPILKTTLSRPKAIPSSIPVDSDLQEYYLYFQKKGYTGDMGEWMKECIRNYLIDHGIEIAVVIRPVGEVHD
jgi:hypothetical protein